MFGSPFTLLRRPAILCWLGGGLFIYLVPNSACGGEKIRITEGGEKWDVPGRSRKQDFLEQPFDFLRSRGSSSGGSLIPSLPPPEPQTSARPAKREDNWMFSSPDKWDQDAALKQIFKIREYKFETLEGRSKPGWESASPEDSKPKHQSPALPSLENPFARPELERGLGYGTTNRLGRSGFSSEEEHSAERGTISELNLNNLLSPNRSLDALSRGVNDLIRKPGLANSLGRTFTASDSGPLGRTREQEKRAQDFEALLKNGRTSALFPLNDPVLSQPDGTRQEINPTKGRRVENFAPSTIQGPGKDPFTDLARSSARPSALDALNTKILGASSLSPAVALPLPPLVFQPKPPVLEVPRRKF